MSRLLAFMVLCWSTAMPVVAIADNSDWPMYNHDVRGTRHNAAEWRLNLFNVGGLGVAWRVNTPGAVTGTPAVVDDYLYVGDWAGNFYALDADCGGNRWTAHALAPVSASALVNCDQVFFGDQGGFIYALDRYSGALRWQVRPNPHPLAAIFGSPTPVEGKIVVGISSNEEQAAADPGYPCCSFRGSVVMLDPLDGRVVWQTWFISEAESAGGSSGASVWGTPTYDEDLDLIFVATSNNYSFPATSRSDAFFALDRRTGAIVWENQRIQNDVSNFRIPWRENIDAGIGDSPQVYRLPGGRKVIGAGSKNGVYWVLDAATGQLLHERRIQTGGSLGGLFSDSAVAYGVVFANGIDWAEPFNFETLPTGGLLTAFTGDTKNVLWQVTTPHSVNQSGVAVANAVVYFSSCNPGTGDRLGNDVGSLHALSAITGRTLANINLGDCALSGPAIAGGKIYVGTGNMLQFATIPPGTVTALGL